MLSKVILTLSILCGINVYGYTSDNVDSIGIERPNIIYKKQTWCEWVDQKLSNGLLATGKVVGFVVRRSILPLTFLAKFAGVDASSNYYHNKQNTISSPLDEQFNRPHSKYEPLRFLSEDYQDNYSQSFFQANKPISSFLEISTDADRRDINLTLDQHVHFN